MHYVSWFALCLFLGSSETLIGGSRWRRAMTALAICALTVNVAFVARRVQNDWLYRYRMVKHQELRPIRIRYPDQVADEIVEQILQRYGVPMRADTTAAMDR